MASTRRVWVSFLLVLILSFSSFQVQLHAAELVQQSLLGDRKNHIVYMGHASHCQGDGSAQRMLLGIISSVLGPIASQLLIRTYHYSLCGCVLKITDFEANSLRKLDTVISVFPDESVQLLTTRSWDFLGMHVDVARNNASESNVIVGVIDSGIYPESPSFNDKGLGCVPSKWKGMCDPSLNFTCNRKIIGARSLLQNQTSGNVDEASPRDYNGHGTHTASTVAGSLVEGASFFGLGKGIARGGVSAARIAIYKVCGSDGSCKSSDILAAFDIAIHDGVDMLSVSLGGGEAQNPFEDPIAIGACHAMLAGILTSVAAGNSGPGPGTVSNVAPWMLSVGASTTDRSFFTDVSLGDGTSYRGISINPKNLWDKPLISGVNAKNQYSEDVDSRLCRVGSLDKNLVQGKIVLCEGLSALGAFMANASGAILTNDIFLDLPRIFPLPVSQIDTDSGGSVKDYAKSGKSPTATIWRSIETRQKAPFVARFSSRGPNPIWTGVLKPDVCAPGVAIMAAWTNVTAPTNIGDDKQRVTFNIISGTSMACPHATAAAAYVKSYNPTFSPAAIQSALMTTASPVNPDPLAEFSYGAGQINPLKAKNPGLVYDANALKYIYNFLCLKRVPAFQLRLIFGDVNISCNTTGSDLNYPSIAFQSKASSFSHKFIRKVKNVGSNSGATYKVSVITSSPSLTVVIHPEVLKFTCLGQEKQFSVRINGTLDDKLLVSGAFIWDDGVHKVKSPIVVYRNLI